MLLNPTFRPNDKTNVAPLFLFLIAHLVRLNERPRKNSSDEV